jgi:hypothetical protein
MEDEERQQRHEGADGECGQGAETGGHRRTHRLGRKPDLLAHEGVDRALGILHDAIHDEIRFPAGQALGLVYLTQNAPLLLGSVMELMALEFYLIVEQFPLRSH